MRLYKTRSIASEALRSGRVKMNGIPIKASHEVKVGEVYELTIDQLHKVVRVKELQHNRVAAKLVEQYMEDMTPQEEYERIQMVRQFGFEKRDRGIGRPTKRDRRDIESLKGKF